MEFAAIMVVWAIFPIAHLRDVQMERSVSGVTAETLQTVFSQTVIPNPQFTFMIPMSTLRGADLTTVHLTVKGAQSTLWNVSII